MMSYKFGGKLRHSGQQRRPYSMWVWSQDEASGLRAWGVGRGVREEQQLGVEGGAALPFLVLFQKKPKVSIVID